MSSFPRQSSSNSTPRHIPTSSLTSSSSNDDLAVMAVTGRSRTGVNSRPIVATIDSSASSDSDTDQTFVQLASRVSSNSNLARQRRHETSTSRIADGEEEFFGASLQSKPLFNDSLASSLYAAASTTQPSSERAGTNDQPPKRKNNSSSFSLSAPMTPTTTTSALRAARVQQKQQRKQQQPQHQQQPQQLHSSTAAATTTATATNPNLSFPSSFQGFNLYHSSPTQAAELTRLDTISYLKSVRCPTILPRFRDNPVFPSTNPATATPSSSTNEAIPAPIAAFLRQRYSSMEDTTGNRPISQVEEIALSFTPLPVAMHIVNNIRNFKHPLHNIYSVQRFNTSFPMSLCGGYVHTPKETSCVLNKEAPIVLDEEDEGSGMQSKQRLTQNADTNDNNPVMYDLLGDNKRNELLRHVPSHGSRQTTSATLANGQTVHYPQEARLSDAQLAFLYRLPYTSIQRDRQGNTSASNAYTNGLLSGLIELLLGDVESDKRLRALLRPLLLDSTEIQQLQQVSSSTTNPTTQNTANSPLPIAEAAFQTLSVLGKGNWNKNTNTASWQSSSSSDDDGDGNNGLDNTTSNDDTHTAHDNVNDDCDGDGDDDDLFDSEPSTTTTTTPATAISSSTTSFLQSLTLPSGYAVFKVNEQGLPQLDKMQKRKLYRDFIYIPPQASNGNILRRASRKMKCPLCFDRLSSGDPVMTKCGHLGCHQCLEQAIQLLKMCPTCRTPLKSGEYYRLYG